MEIKINKEQELYVIPSYGGYSCLGFDVCLEEINRMSAELQIQVPEVLPRGSIEAYNFRNNLSKIAEEQFRATGERLQCELIPELIGHEGERVRIHYDYIVRYFRGKEVNYIQGRIGKSTGWSPIHLLIKTSRSYGGESILRNRITKIEFLGD